MNNKISLLDWCKILSNRIILVQRLLICLNYNLNRLEERVVGYCLLTHICNYINHKTIRRRLCADFNIIDTYFVCGISGPESTLESMMELGHYLLEAILPELVKYKTRHSSNAWFDIPIGDEDVEILRLRVRIDALQKCLVDMNSSSTLNQ